MAAPLGSVWLADAQRFRTEDEQTEGTMPDSVFQLGWAAQVRLDPPRCPPDAYPSTDAVTFSVRRRSSRRARRSRATRRGLPHHSACTLTASSSWANLEHLYNRYGAWSHGLEELVWPEVDVPLFRVLPFRHWLFEVGPLVGKKPSLR